jgi:hypothetical protein
LALTARQLAVDCFVTCKLVPASPESGKLSLLGRPDLNKPAAGQPRSAAAITVINACALGRVGERRKVEAGIHAQQNPAMLIAN